MDLLAASLDRQLIERLHRAVRLAVDRAECREVMTSDEMVRASLHRVGVERQRDVPHTPFVERRRGPAIEDPVEVAAPDAGKAGVPVVGDRLDRDHAHRVRADKGVGAFAETMGRHVPCDVDMGGHGQRRVAERMKRAKIDRIELSGGHIDPR